MAGKTSLSIDVGLTCGARGGEHEESWTEVQHAHFDSLQNGRVEDVDTSVDAVADEILGLLDKAVDGRLSSQCQNNTIL